ncbi:MAG: ATP synthase subunit I [Bacillota bacterium]|nr:ATP synthase subunit I [Bacillota bacterium]
MEKQTRDMLKKVAIYDIIILVLTLGVSSIVLREYALILGVGILIAAFNFIVNAIVTTYTLISTGKRTLSILGAVVRVIITLIIAMLFYNNNKFNLIAFIGGYSLHYIAIIIYGMTIRNQERK